MVHSPTQKRALSGTAMENDFDINSVTAEFLSNQVDRFFESLKTVGKNVSDRAKLALTDSLRSYVSKIYERHSHARSFFHRNEPAFLYSFYVPIGVRCQTLSIPKANASSLVARSTRIVIQGSGGCGKSTLSRHLLLDILRQKSKIPIFVELREINRTKENLDALILKSVRASGLEVEKSLFDRALESGLFAIIFDGYDELDLSERQTISQRIRAIGDEHKDNWIIVTSRPDDEFNGWTNFCIFDTMPLSLEQALELVELSPVEYELKTKFSDRLKGDLYEQHKSFLSNPLLLSIMLVTFHDTAEIPSKLSVFYSQAYEALFQRHDAWKGGFNRQKECGLDIHDFARLFSGFSILAYDQRLFSFTKTAAISLVKKGSELTGVRVQADAFLRDAIQAICLLVEDGLQISYSHRSFQEFFSARFIADSPPEIKIPLAQRVSANSRFDNVLILLFELQPTFVETSILLPAVRQFLTKLKIKGATVSRAAHLRFLKSRFDNFRIGQDGLCYAENILKADRPNDRLPDLALRLCGNQVGWGEWASQKEWDEFRAKHYPFGKEHTVETAGLTISDPLIDHLYDYGHYFGAAFLKKQIDLVEILKAKKVKADGSLANLFGPPKNIRDDPFA